MSNINISGIPNMGFAAAAAVFRRHPQRGAGDVRGTDQRRHVGQLLPCHGAVDAEQHLRRRAALAASRPITPASAPPMAGKWLRPAGQPWLPRGRQHRNRTTSLAMAALAVTVRAATRH